METTGRNPSTVSRGLRRNSREGLYSASRAQRRADKKHGPAREEEDHRTRPQSVLTGEDPGQAPVARADLWQAQVRGERGARRGNHTPGHPRAGTGSPGVQTHGQGTPEKAVPQEQEEKEGDKPERRSKIKTPGTSGNTLRRRKAVPGWAVGKPTPCRGT